MNRLWWRLLLLGLAAEILLTPPYVWRARARWAVTVAALAVLVAGLLYLALSAAPRQTP